MAAIEGLAAWGTHGGDPLTCPPSHYPAATHQQLAYRPIGGDQLSHPNGGKDLGFARWDRGNGGRSWGLAALGAYGAVTADLSYAAS